MIAIVLVFDRHTVSRLNIKTTDSKVSLVICEKNVEAMFMRKESLKSQLQVINVINVMRSQTMDGMTIGTQEMKKMHGFDLISRLEEFI